ncbi:alpha/beta hydrolase [Oleiharenicola lentus]|uniref:Alpha/beta hydrolase n=1 Tax=Oleiharenicola lentus TaxID=2508720 RepID=A0A4Q1C9P7_9BACT|nr:alpha/beta hydrolase [Oleiharenicola lentus]RXK55572.1 alpha/beta hydrolase [Oleiharenicola lentus]
MNSTLPSSKTIVLIHGLWVTPRSWEKFQGYYEARGYRVLAPAWPGLKGEVEDMQRDASSFNGTGLEQVVAHYTKIIEALPEKPIIVGHSYGGLITQILIDRGLGAAGVAIDSVSAKGIKLLPFSTYEALTPALANPFNVQGTYLFPFARWWRVFANSLSETEARAAYARYAIPAPGKAIFDAALSNFTPGSLAAIDFRNSNRAPLLFIGGENDVIMPASLNRKNFRKYRHSSAVTEYQEFAGRSHFIIGEAGWEEVAAYALDWALSHATPAALLRAA